MKNFRKTIIALATVAAMLVPSVAMAKTITATVDKDIAGDVYVGFYDGAILKDVVKTTVADATVAAPAAAADLPMTVTITDEILVSEKRTDVELHQLIFTATGDASIDKFNVAMSWDNTVIQPVTSAATNKDLTIDKWTGTTNGGSAVPTTSFEYYDEDEDDYLTKEMNRLTAKVATVGNRDGAYLGQYVQGAAADCSEGFVFMKFYYYVKAGKTVAADTFKIETELNDMNAAINSAGSENGIKLNNFTYGCWNNGAAIADTIALVTPWDTPVDPEPTTKDLAIEVPAGAEGYAATMFIWDANQIAQCAPITNWN